jgi:hypothetical protein
VRRAGNRIRVTAQLIDAADGYHLWSERFDRELADVFAVQDEIAAAITFVLRERLTTEFPPDRRYTPLLAAYEAYLRARHYQWQLNPESMASARESYERAIALDPGFALARIGYADYFLALCGLAQMPADEAMPRVRAEAQRALDLDVSLPEAHAMLGCVAGLYDFDWVEAERHFRLASGARRSSACTEAFSPTGNIRPLARWGSRLDSRMSSSTRWTPRNRSIKGVR